LGKRGVTQLASEFFQGVSNRIDNQMFDILAADFTSMEVMEATQQLKSNSAPGPDGVSALFYHKFWEIVGQKVLDYTLNILNNGGNPADINFTYISLIPKINSPNTPTDFRPISLCNVIMKIVTKTIANRLKLILPNINTENESAFIPGRLITDNTLLAFEAFHYLKRPREHDNGYVGIKLDIAKAYDSLEWVFIEKTLLLWVSPPRW
jgi:hypothetical protein